MFRILKAVFRFIYEVIMFAMIRWPLAAIGFVAYDIFAELKYGWNRNIIYSYEVIQKSKATQPKPDGGE